MFRKNKEYIEFLELELHYLGDKLSDQIRKNKNPEYRPRTKTRHERHRELYEKYKAKIYGQTTTIIDYENP